MRPALSVWTPPLTKKLVVDVNIAHVLDRFESADLTASWAAKCDVNVPTKADAIELYEHASSL
jgi:hypothetical protein